MANSFDAVGNAVSMPERIPVAAPSQIRPVVPRAGLRMGLMVIAAFCIYGTWAFFANVAHGASVALRAGLTQGASSGVTTLVIGSVIEALHAALPFGRRRALLATGISASLAALVHLGLHLAMGTP